MLDRTRRSAYRPLGLRLWNVSRTHRRSIQVRLWEWFARLGIGAWVDFSVAWDSPESIDFRLRPDVAERLVPQGNTLDLATTLAHDSRSSRQALEREIVVALLASPARYAFPSLAEFEAQVRMRINITTAARRSRLEFRTQTAERPPEFWVYDDDRGFLLRPGVCLIEALREATQPSDPTRRYSFSCWRATEHLALLAIAEETAQLHPRLFARISRQSETRALKAAAFEATYFRKHGSATQPLPVRYFVPGDRTWFRNPDPVSADVTGFEGSFTFYVGHGEFADFWRQGAPYTLTTKCLTIYFWRQAVERNADGELQVNEARVEQLVRRALRDPVATERILQELVRWQGPEDVPGGGAIERHRDTPQYVCPTTSSIELPDVTEGIEAPFAFAGK